MKKRTVCRYYSTVGSCYYGDQCQFSHSQPGSQVDRSGNTHGFEVVSLSAEIHFYIPTSAVELGSTGLGRGAGLGKRPSLGGGAYLHIRKQEPSPGVTELKLNPPSHHQELQRRQAACLTVPLEGACPTEVEHYHSLCMLENPVRLYTVAMVIGL
eukprot:Em0022g933a